MDYADQQFHKAQMRGQVETQCGQAIHPLDDQAREPRSGCAHLLVLWTTQNDRGMVRGWWQCSNCWMRFVPKE